jgi:hypothetical protein
MVTLASMLAIIGMLLGGGEVKGMRRVLVTSCLLLAMISIPALYGGSGVNVSHSISVTIPIQMGGVNKRSRS